MVADNITYNQPVRKSVVVLALQLLFLQFCVGLATLVTNWILVSWIDSYAQTSYFLLALGVSTIVFQALDAGMLVLLVFYWARTSYLITPDKLLIKSGLLRVRTTTIKLDDITSVEVEQSLLGRLFNYGTIVFRTPSPHEADREIKLTNIPEPQHYRELLEQKISA